MPDEFDPQLREFLGDVPLFANLDGSVLEHISLAAGSVHVPAGAWLFRQGDEGDTLYIVRSGRLEIVNESEDDRVVGLLDRGASFGELALLTGGTRAAGARALRESELITLHRDRFRELLSESLEFVTTLTATLGAQLQRSGMTAALPPRRRSVLTVLPLDPSVPAGAFTDTLAATLRGWGRAAVLTARDLHLEAGEIDDVTGPAGRRLDELEREHDVVVLHAGVMGGGRSDDPTPGVWADFCLRQADHTLVLVGTTTPLPPESVVPGLRHCDLVVFGDRPAGSRYLGRWLDALEPRSHHWIETGTRNLGAATTGFHESVQRTARRITGRSTGVVLSGGGARGYAHIGALAALGDAGVVIDRIGGTSMGSFMAAMYAMGLGTDDMVRICRRELAERRPFGDYTLPRYALITGKRGQVMLRRVFGDLHIEEMPLPWFCISADMLTAEEVIHSRGPVTRAIQASISLPGLAPPLGGDGRLLVDGAMLNNLPVDVMASTGEGPVIAIDVMRSPTRAQTPPTRPVSRFERLTDRWIIRHDGSFQLPGIRETLTSTAMLSSSRRADANRAMAELVITPDLGDIQLLEWDRIDHIVAAGRLAADHAIAAWRGR